MEESDAVVSDIDNSTRQCGSKLKVNIGNQDTILVDVVTNLTAKRYAQNITTKDQQNEDPFYVVNLGQLLSRYDKWMANLRQVHPFYAVKCNDNPAILKTLAGLGCGFDCASKGEIEAILKLGVSPDKIIYAHPCKQISHLKYAASNGVSMMTFDNEAEIHKIKEHFYSASLVLRLATNDSASTFGLSSKFGCSVQDGKKLLELCDEWKMNIIGVSFHVGSLCTSPSAYQDALARCAELFSYADSIGYHFTLLDIGGGFPGQKGTDTLFGNLSVGITEALNKHFSSSKYPDLNIIAEPGYYFGCSSCSLTVTVIGKRCFADGDIKKFEYYLNDGVHGSFATAVSHNFLQCLPVLLCPETADQEKYSTTLWGQTCDSVDKICVTSFPELNVGDRLYFEDMGGYTMSRMSTFNGFSPPTKFYYINENDRVQFQHLNQPMK